MCNILNCWPEGHSASIALEVIHCKDKLKMRLLLHRCKEATLCTGGFFDIKSGSVDDDGDAHNEFVTTGKPSTVSDSDKNLKGFADVLCRLAGGALPTQPCGPDGRTAPCPAPAALRHLSQLRQPHHDDKHKHGLLH